MTASNDAGAHFFRSDFQVHTPRDQNWKGSRPITPEDRREYAQRFVAACRSKGLQAVAVTDHHDFALFPYIKEAAQGEVDAAGELLPARQRLIVFPGLELTLAVPCQALLILDADFPEERLGDVLAALSIEAVDSGQGKLPNVTRLDHFQDFVKLHDDLDLKPWLKGRYIILPNVTDGGYQTLMRSGMQSKYKEMPCVGGYLDGTVEKKAKVGSGNRQKFEGLDAAWGNKRLALFQTSDSRSETFAQLGVHSTWVKWASPTAEALRQACLAQESRISQTQPSLPNVFISHIHISNSSFLGPVDLDLNAQYNAVIGGRGTGKSTLLDYVRWCLGDVPTGGDVDDELPATTRRKRLIASTLTSLSAEVEVTVVINGITHVVKRDARTGELSLKVGAEDFVRATEASIQSLLPIHAYSQKQLSSVSVRLDELSRFVTAPIRQLLELKDRDVLALSNRLRENYASLQRFRSLGDAISRNELDERSQADQASHLRSTLSGLSAEDQQQLDSRPIVDRAREVSHRWQRATDEAERDVQELIGRIDSAASLTSAPPTEAAGELRRDLDAAYDDVTRSLQTLKQSLQQALAAFTAMRAGQGAASARRALEERLEALDTAYTAVKQRSTAHAEQLAQLAAIEKRRADIASELERLRSERISLGDPKDAHVQLRAELNALTVERSDLLAKQCEVVTELSGGLLRATLSRGRGLGGVQERFRGLASGSGTRASKIEAFFAALAKETDPLATWELCLAELEALLLVPDGEDFTSELTPTLSRLGLNVADQQRVRTRMTVDSWLDLALTPVVDEPVFEYRTKEDTYIAFESASAGQQATALLRVLLSQSGMPLIIDQPEEDLDSQVVQEVVEWLWTAKSKRQVIFASHNANLVVNGDAELVVICDYRRSGDQSGGKVKLQGAIDIPEIRSEITKVMEGGEKAFRLRKEKYGF